MNYDADTPIPDLPDPAIRGVNLFDAGGMQANDKAELYMLHARDLAARDRFTWIVIWFNVALAGVQALLDIAEAIRELRDYFRSQQE